MYESSAPNPVIAIIYIAVVILLIVSNWKIFTKAGKPGWAILIPIYNIVVMLEIVDKPIWWIVLLFIPIANIVVGIMIIYNLVLKFGKPGWHTILALLVGFIYYPYLAFSDAQYNAGA